MSELVHREWVRPEWLDYNGHLSEAFYVLVFGHATDGLLDAMGLDADYRERNGCSLYTVEAHVRYLQEVPGERELTVSSVVAAFDAKRVHVCHEMYVAGELVATEELLAVHVDQHAGRSCELPGHATVWLESAGGPAPEYAGRSVGLRRRSTA